MSGPPSYLDPIPFDAEAGERLEAACRTAVTRLTEVRAARAQLVSRARRDWTGPYREAFDAADDDLLDAMRLAGNLADDVRSRVASQQGSIEFENGQRARARARWYEQEALRAAEETCS